MGAAGFVLGLVLLHLIAILLKRDQDKWRQQLKNFKR